MLEEYAADRGQDFAHTSYQSPVELMAEVEKGTRFDIILLDVLMPGENGMAAPREIREYDSNVKIIFLTSSTEFAVESYAVDAWYYQLKPIRREDFFRLMDSACAACTRAVSYTHLALHIELSQKIRKARKKLGMSQKMCIRDRRCVFTIRLT